MGAWRSISLAVRRIPVAIAGLIAATALVSILAAVMARNGMPALWVHGLLVVPEVWRGQLWRLVTWVLYEQGPIALLFACLMLFWFGRDLLGRWGTRRFLARYFGLAAGAAAVTVLAGLASSSVAGVVQGGSWPVMCGLIVAWGLEMPQRPLRLFGVVPLVGRHLVWLTVGGTVLFALFGGVAPYVPHFAAEALVFLALGPLRRARVRVDRERKARAAAWSFDEWLDRDRRKRG
jgi:membrane associated rhomboid family serine protease